MNMMHATHNNALLTVIIMTRYIIVEKEQVAALPT
jgi:hypothetical protein